jgi:5-methylcytosine-specific restriction endonuclease McrA
VKPPSAEDQLVFLSKLQRLFAEGDFTATYKFALLIALADLAVELGKDDGEALEINHRQIAAKFIELYWQQATPYSGNRLTSGQGVLIQNSGTQAAVVTAIEQFRQNHPGTTLLSAGSQTAYQALLLKVSQTIAAQPINYLQNMGGRTDPFLFERMRGAVVLKPGVSYCLRRFQPLVQQLARSHWVRHLKHNKLNLRILGEADDLESFLFETSRQTLIAIGVQLKKLTNRTCFYCECPVYEADVDHFVPFSLYPRDLMHNFVLSHPSCNRSKSDTLAAKPHLERWLDFITANDDALREIGASVGRPANLTSTRAVASWGYGNAVTSGSNAWLKAGSYQPVDMSFLECLT